MIIEKQSCRRHTEEFKDQAEKHVLSGQPVAAVARELGVGDSLIHKRLQDHPIPYFFSLYHKVRSLISSRRAARVLLPPVCARARAM